MKLISRLLLTLLVLLLLVVIAAYIGIQTPLGARWISQSISNNTSYQVAIVKIEHSLLSPLRIELQELSLSTAGKPPLLTVKNARLEFSLLSWREGPQLRLLSLQNGLLDLQPGRLPALLTQTEQLQLQQMALHINQGDWQIEAKGVNASIMPWLPTPELVLGSNSRFQLSAEALTLNGVTMHKALLQGHSQQGVLALDDFGADIAQGQITGTAQQKMDSSWLITNLQLSHIRWQSGQTLRQLWQQIAQWPTISIQRFDLLDARLEGADWVFADLYLNIRNILLQQGHWMTEKGSLDLSAINLIVGSLELTDPILKLELAPEKIAVKQFTTRWQNGLLRTHGQWLRDNHELQLDELVIAGLEYTLPEQWYRIWRQPMPTWLNRFSIAKLSVSRNLIIDIDSAFPFQLTRLDGYGKDLLLVDDHRVGLWQGELTLNASDATFNKVELSRPMVKLHSADQRLQLTELSAFTQGGLLEATGSMGLSSVQPFKLSLSGRSVALDLLKQWGWGGSVLADSGSLQLELQGEAAATIPFKQTLQGTLSAKGEHGDYHQQMQQGQVVSAPE